MVDWYCPSMRGWLRPSRGRRPIERVSGIRASEGGAIRRCVAAASRAAMNCRSTIRPNADSVGVMEAAQALRELMELSSQITAAVVLDAEGSVLAAAPEDSAGSGLVASTLELVAAAADLGHGGTEVTRVEVELEDGAFFVVREGGRTVAALTGPKPTSGLVVYDLRTCAQAVDVPEPKKRRSTRKPKEAAE
jgi:predicted regulator of Ras-like GTPase activity (Roadblock/LC7/MglB family)